LMNLCGIATGDKAFETFIVTFVKKDPVNAVPVVIVLYLRQHRK
jgi:hypothetical protein